MILRLLEPKFFDNLPQVDEWRVIRRTNKIVEGRLIEESIFVGYQPDGTEVTAQVTDGKLELITRSPAGTRWTPWTDFQGPSS